MNSLTYICIGAGLMIYYYVVLRRFNSLGFRMFSLFTFITLCACYWVYQDSLIEKAVQKSSQVVRGTITSKRQVKSSSSSSLDNEISVALATTPRRIDTLTSVRYISTDEWASWKLNDQIDLYYVDSQQLVIPKVSFDRYLNDRWGLYIGIGIFFLIGVACWFFLKRYNIGVDPDTGHEWLEKDGKIYFDERRSKFSQTMKRVNILSKMIQLLGR
ncbi:hypothetical protein IC229_20060 [Spirosoma sp. BT702]|uniref:Uncharacterized protein n=1 Tax=Spirosoma profusum TaxID=2771354 RepID=A0A926XY82_9BACT|nr:hypothetical protein [Spirosoma profusum]MBD2702952.1 hypothetical protein [Spirosoma profusum]